MLPFATQEPRYLPIIYHIPSFYGRWPRFHRKFILPQRSSRDPNTTKNQWHHGQELFQSLGRPREKRPGFPKTRLPPWTSHPQCFSTWAIWWQSHLPTTLYRDFLAKTTQFKAWEMLLHRLNQENILFLLSAAFAGHLYNVNWLWPTPAISSGNSIFFCPEPTSASITMDPDRGLALLDKVERVNISKLTKEKFEFPYSIINAIFILQNFWAIIALCFGEHSNSAICIKNWISHMMKRCQMYHSCQESDHTFSSHKFSLLLIEHSKFIGVPVQTIAPDPMSMIASCSWKTPSLILNITTFPIYFKPFY